VEHGSPRSPADADGPVGFDLRGRALDGRYRLLERLGAGGMGTVYLAEHTALETKVAVKVMRPDLAAEERHRRRFLREAKAASAIKSDRVVRTSDFGVTGDGHVYFVMEFIEGEDLAKLLRRERRLPWVRARSLLIEIAQALAAAHDVGIVHRDVKPSNCMLVYDSEQTHVKVLDFGVAKMVHDRPTEELTGTSEMLGTVSYMAPELTQGKSATRRSDIYSFGVLMYRVLTGFEPFRGETAFQVLVHHVSTPPMPPTALAADIPLAVEACILRAMQKDPAARWPDCHAIVQALEQIDARQEATAVSPAPAQWSVATSADVATVMESGPIPMPGTLPGSTLASEPHADTDAIGRGTGRRWGDTNVSESITRTRPTPRAGAIAAVGLGVALAAAVATSVWWLQSRPVTDGSAAEARLVPTNHEPEHEDVPEPVEGVEGPVASAPLVAPDRDATPAEGQPEDPVEPDEVEAPPSDAEAPGVVADSDQGPTTSSVTRRQGKSTSKPQPVKKSASPPSVPSDDAAGAKLRREIVGTCPADDGSPSRLRIKAAIGTDGRVLSATVGGGTPAQRGCARQVAKRQRFPAGATRVYAFEVDA
jgi:serine/threonine protein kinase